MNFNFKINNISYNKRKSFNNSVERLKRKKRNEYIVLSSIIIIFFLILIFLNSSFVKIKNINIDGLTQIDRTELLKEIDIDNNMKLWKVNEEYIQKYILDNYSIISSVEVKKKYLNTLYISVKEKKVIAKEINDDGTFNIILEDNTIYDKKLLNDSSIPIINDFNEDKNKKDILLENLKKLNPNVLVHISEIINDKNSEYLSYIYMKDGQKVKINVNSFSEKLNYYFKMEKDISDKKNTLLNLVNGTYLETENSNKLKERKVKNLLG